MEGKELVRTLLDLTLEARVAPGTAGVAVVGRAGVELEVGSNGIGPLGEALLGAIERRAHATANAVEQTVARDVREEPQPGVAAELSKAPGTFVVSRSR
jgi:hypothetical protein